MKKQSIYLITALVPAMLFLSSGAEAKKAISCNQKFALCNTSACMKVPGIKNKSLCTCSVENGLSASFKSCAKRAGKKDHFGNTRLTSSYSFANADNNPQMTCTKGFWASCLDAPCVVDPKDSSKAYCTCPLHKGPYITQGGNCKTNTCSNTLWSGAKSADAVKLATSLIESTKTQASPIKMCPVNTN